MRSRLSALIVLALAIGTICLSEVARAQTPAAAANGSSSSQGTRLDSASDRVG